MVLSSGLVHALVLLACMVGFGMVVREQLRTYIDQETYMAVNYESRDSPPLFDMPALVFCPVGSGRAPNMLGMSPWEYNRSVARLEVAFHGAQLSQYDEERRRLEHVVEDLFTIYNGACTVYIIKKRVPPQLKINFR